MGRTMRRQMISAVMATLFAVTLVPTVQGEVIPVTKAAKTTIIAKEKQVIPSPTNKKVVIAKTDTKEASQPVKKVTTMGPPVRVLLGTRSQAVTLTGSGTTGILQDSKWKQTTKSPITVMVKNNQVYVNNKKMGTTVTIGSPSGKDTITVLGTAYRGEVQITARPGNTMRIVNRVPLEEYIYGVVPQEVVPSWPAPALEAQAVAARTYALHTMETRKNEPYDMTNTDSSQVYGGFSKETVTTTAAVRATQGMVMTYQGKPINALFHSTGGGYTEHAENVWGQAVPYLRGVKDDDSLAPSKRWMVRSTRKQIEQTLRSASKDVGILKRIDISPLSTAPMKVADRGVSGRIKQLTFVGTKKSITLDGDQIRKLFGLKSTLCDFYIGYNPLDPLQKPTKKQIAKQHVFTKADDAVYIVGSGWGHGLGLSQWGAAAMAKQGKNKKNYYETILKHYYTGIALEKWY